MAGLAKIIWRGLPYAVVTAVAFMAQVAPHEAKAHVVEWWERTGAPAPQFLQHPHIDAQVTTTCIVLLILWTGVLWLLHRRERQREGAPVDYMTPHEAIHYIADESCWGWKKRREKRPGTAGGQPVMLKAMALLEAPAEFQREAQREGSAVRVWGTLEWSAKSEPIPHTFWMANGLCPDQIFYPERLSRTQPSIAFAGSNPQRYERLKIDRAGVRKTWRRMSLIKRLIIRHQIWKEQREWQKTASA